MEALAVPFLLAVGALLAVQAAANVQLSAAVGSPIAASTLQLAVGAALLLALAVLVGAVEHLDRVPDAPAWHLVGGVGSAIYITAGILLFPRIGAIVTVGLFIAGQMAVSLVLDGFGWLGLPRDGLGATAWVGAAAVVAGAALIVQAQAGPASNSRGRVAGRVGPAWIALALAAGAVLPVQGAINAQLRSDLDAPVATGAFSFLVATAAMLAALAVLGRFAGRPRQGAGLASAPWWGWLGGLCGAAYVTSVFVLIPEIGAAATVSLTVAGQQLASVLVDRRGLLRLPRRAISPLRLIGVGLLLVGVALIELG
jgi:bacterial/archaeal transporter family-2 protein